MTKEDFLEKEVLIDSGDSVSDFFWITKEKSGSCQIVSFKEIKDLIVKLAVQYSDKDAIDWIDKNFTD